MTQTTTTVVTDEAQALAALDELCREHELPRYVRAWLQILHPDHVKMCRVDPTVFHVWLFDRGDIPAWAVALNNEAKTEHTIHEYEDGRWCAVWTEVILVQGWLPGVRLSVAHTEDRWIERP